MKKKGFTLIELIAVLVIMAILALIVTPLVMSIIRKARVSADKRSIDAYGRSIELAIASYLLDTGKFPTDVSQLTIEYSGSLVECSTTQLNSDSSVYLSGCTVGGRTVDYVYGKDKQPKSYSIGDEVSYNNEDYYVIKNSGINDLYLTLLKKNPLTVAEVNQYGTGHVNMYACQSSDSSCYQTAYDSNGYGGMAYYTSSSCIGYGVSSDCTANYEQSEIKYVVDAWKLDKAPLATEARLITLDDLTDNLGIEFNTNNPTSYQIVQTDDSPMWVFGEDYYYWTMTTNTDKTSEVWSISSRSNGMINSNGVQYGYIEVVRPVIVLDKSVL